MPPETLHYQDQLLSTAEQLDVLRQYNQTHWEGHFSEDELKALDVSYEYPDPTNMPVIHAEFESTWHTYDAWSRVYINSEISHLNTLPGSQRDFDSYVQLHDQTVQYEPGLHIVRMDLTRNRDTYRTMPEAYKDVEETPGLFLAHGEVLSLVGLHRALRKAGSYVQRETPYIPGYQARNVFVPDAYAKNWDWTVRFNDHVNGGLGLNVLPTKGTATINGAVPLVHGNPEKSER